MKPTLATIERRLETLESQARAAAIPQPETFTREEKIIGILNAMQTLDGAALDEELAQLIGRAYCRQRAARLVELLELARSRRDGLVPWPLGGAAQ